MSDEGGDPACWLEWVCESCGVVADAQVCPACGHRRDDEETRDDP